MIDVCYPLIVICVLIFESKSLISGETDLLEPITNFQSSVQPVKIHKKTIINETIQSVSASSQSLIYNQQFSEKTKSQNNNEQNPIQWPIQGEFYHIYSALNPSFVVDVARAPDGYHDLILYSWANRSNQRFSFLKVEGNRYHIMNEFYKEQYLKMSQKTITVQKEVSNRLKFSPGKDILWQLIPANPNIPNSFYIVSEQGMAMDVSKANAHLKANIIQYKFHKNLNQIWILRKNQRSAAKIDQNHDNHKEIIALAWYNAISVPQSVIEAMELQDIKYEFRHKNIALPEWFRRPPKPKLQVYDIPFETTYDEFYKSIKEKLVRESQQQDAEIDSEDIEMQDNEKGPNSQDKKTAPTYSLKSKYIAIECAQNTKVAYIWLGSKPLPIEYRQLLQRCAQNTILLKNQHFTLYSQQWNSQQPNQKIPSQLPIRQQVNLLKLLFLYFQSGAYSDFDTQINEPCWEQIYTDEIIFTNRIDENTKYIMTAPIEEVIVPQENFMMVRNKFNSQVKRMIEQEILENNNHGGNRWKECLYRQCLIVECQRHYRDNTYMKGYD